MEELDFLFRTIINKKDEVFLIQISKCDEEFYDANKWYVAKGYLAYTPKHKLIYYHHEVMNTSKGLLCDHKNGVPLDNRRSNLRNCTKGQNRLNVRTKKSKHGYKGVFKDARCPNFPWFAVIVIDKKDKYLGYYKTKELAAKAYDEGAKKYHGEFACLNEVV